MVRNNEREYIRGAVVLSLLRLWLREREREREMESDLIWWEIERRGELQRRNGSGALSNRILKDPKRAQKGPKRKRTCMNCLNVHTASINSAKKMCPQMGPNY